MRVCDSCLIGHSPLVGAAASPPSPPARARAADEWQRITDEDTVTRLTLLHSRWGGGVEVWMEGGGEREREESMGVGGADGVLVLQNGGGAEGTIG